MPTDAFSLSPNPNALYVTQGLKATIYQVKSTITRRQGLCSILGDKGAGKSTVMRYIYAELSAREDMISAFYAIPQFPSLFGMIKSICTYFEIPPCRSLLDQNDKLQEFLVKSYQDGKNVVLFIDEAQMLNNSLLEGVRALLNFETNTAKLIQVAMAGTFELKARLNKEVNSALKSRIHTYSLLSPLTDKEMREMIAYRCQVADIRNPFTDDALDQIYDLSKGFPRLVMKICDKSYEYMEIAGTDAVTAEFIAPAAEDSAIEVDA